MRRIVTQKQLWEYAELYPNPVVGRYDEEHYEADLAQLPPLASLQYLMEHQGVNYHRQRRWLEWGTLKGSCLRLTRREALCRDSSIATNIAMCRPVAPQTTTFLRP